MGLSKRIREGTKKAHSIAEASSAVILYLKGAVERESYISLIGDYYHIYNTLEEAIISNKTVSAIADIDDSALHRRKALEKDLKYFHGDDWLEKSKPSPAAIKYGNRIKRIANRNPELLVAHHYTRYLGDLSGGQALKIITKNALALPEKALNFYNFTRIDNPGEYKKGYRDRLDNLRFTEVNEERIIKESIKSFELSCAVLSSMESKSNLLMTFCKLIGRYLTTNY